MRIAILCALLAVPGPATAGKTAGVTMPDTITVAGKTLTLNGMGLHEATIFNVDVYVAGLYVEHVSSNAAELVTTDEVKRLVLRFVRDVDAGDIAGAVRDGFEHNATVPVSHLRPLIAQLKQWLPELEDGDTLAFTYVPGTGLSVEVNGTRQGTIDSTDFARSVFAVWLGPRPPNGALKRGLLGHHRPEA